MQEHNFPSVFSGQQMLTQESPVQIAKKKQELKIGIPKESTMQENRIALVPNSVKHLVLNGHQVIMTKGAGEKSSFSDLDYSEAGAELVNDNAEVFKADIIIKTTPPTIEEIDLFRSDQLLISPLQIPMVTREYLEKLKEKRVIALAMEYLQSEDKSFPVVRIMSEIAGVVAILTAAEYLSNSPDSRKVLLGGISGVPPAKVVILGAGIVAEHATRTAMSLGASVRIFDDDINAIMQLQNSIGQHLHTSTINPVYLQYQLLSADVLIGSIHSPDGRSPIIVTEDMVRKMKEGSVIIDVSIDQGGCIETSKMTTHDHPVYTKHGVVHYCVPNIPSKVSRTASIAISNILTPLIINAGKMNSYEALLYQNAGLRNGVYTFKGSLTNQYLANYFNLKYTRLDLLLTYGM
jgi:alanine dehydrogenase